jgi:hypothetical protein
VVVNISESHATEVPGSLGESESMEHEPDHHVRQAFTFLALAAAPRFERILGTAKSF